MSAPISESLKEILETVNYLRIHPQIKALNFKTSSGNSYCVTVRPHKDEILARIIDETLYHCEFCPPKYGFRSGNNWYHFKKSKSGISIHDKIIHWLEFHSIKIAPETKAILEAFFQPSSNPVSKL